MWPICRFSNGYVNYCPLRQICFILLRERVEPVAKHWIIWKKANVTAIFKKGEKSKADKYRPISLPSVPGKLMERLVRNAIVEHMTTNNLFSESQHGFLKGKSCVTQLLEYLEDIT